MFIMDQSSPNIEVEDLYSRFDDFFRKYYQENILRVARNYPDDKRLLLDFKELEMFDFELSEHLLLHPDETISAVERVIRNMDLPIPLQKFMLPFLIFREIHSSL
jgi:replicative DNA helicase Mcm